MHGHGEVGGASHQARQEHGLSAAFRPADHRLRRRIETARVVQRQEAEVETVLAQRLLQRAARARTQTFIGVDRQDERATVRVGVAVERRDDGAQHAERFRCAERFLFSAAKARDESELYLLMADEIKDPAERKSFIRKAISISGKH